MALRRSRIAVALGSLAYLVAVAGALITLWAWGHAAVSVGPAVGGMALMLASVAVLGCRRFIFGPAGVTPVRFWCGVFAVPVLLVTTLVLGVTGVALDLRWRGSEAAFQSKVSSLQRGGSVPSPIRIGSYTIDQIDTAGRGYLFDDAHGGDLTDCGGGYAFLPDGPSDEVNIQYTFVHLDGDWYTWTCSS